MGPYDVRRPLVIDPVLVYSTYLGSGLSQGLGIAVDRRGRAFVTGGSSSFDFPTTAGAFQTAFAGGAADVFVTQMNRSGTALVYSTYLGGSNRDVGRGIAVDGDGNAYVTGETASGDFPSTLGAFKQSLCDSADAFVAKLNRSGSELIYSTYLGGSDADTGSGIAVGRDGRAYVAGRTSSADFPITPGHFPADAEWAHR